MCFVTWEQFSNVTKCITLQSAMKHNIDKARQVLFRMESLLGKVCLQIKTLLQLLMMSSSLLYGGELSGNENLAQIEVFHSNFNGF